MERIVDVSRRLDEAGEPYVQVTVVRRVRPSSAMVGDRAIVTLQGEMIGFVGGQCTKGLVVDQAQQCLKSGESRLLLVTAHPPADPLEGVTVLPMTCHSEGTVELFLEPKLANPLLLIIGDSPIAHALEQLAGFIGLQPCRVALEASSGLEPQSVSERLRSVFRQQCTRQASFAVVATMGLYDVDATRFVLQSESRSESEATLRYLGVVTSPRRWQALQAELLAVGESAESCAFISAPAGVDIGARGPQEIALSILAEVIACRRQTPAKAWQGRSSQPGQADQTDRAGGQSAADRAMGHVAANEVAMTEASGMHQTVIDPVCGMSVDLSRTAHKLTHDGVEYGFCCAGCKDRFVKSQSGVSH